MKACDTSRTERAATDMSAGGNESFEKCKRWDEEGNSADLFFDSLDTPNRDKRREGEKSGRRMKRHSIEGWINTLRGREGRESREGGTHSHSAM